MVQCLFMHCSSRGWPLRKRCAQRLCKGLPTTKTYCHVFCVILYHVCIFFLSNKQFSSSSSSSIDTPIFTDVIINPLKTTMQTHERKRGAFSIHGTPIVFIHLNIPQRSYKQSAKSLTSSRYLKNLLISIPQ